MGRHPPELTRRQLLQAAVTAGAAWLIGIDLAPAHEPRPAGASYSPGAFIRIDPQGQITLVMPQVEMGQGVYTALAMILAEELDADLGRIALQAAPPDDQRYRNPILGFQVTGGSTSVRAFWMPLRKAAASARATLVQAAAQLWKVTPASIRTSAGEALHEASGRRTGYGMLVPLARTLALRDVAPKSLADFRLLG